MKLSELIKKTKLELQDAPFDVSEFEIRELISSATGLPFESLSTNYSQDVDLTALQTFNSYIEKRKTGYPTAYIIKEKGFFKREFIVEEGVLIPRPETEGLVEIVLEEVSKIGKRDVKIGKTKNNSLLESNFAYQSPITQLKESGDQGELKIADLGCGSGCIGLSLLLELPNSKGFLFDISEKAIEVTQKNIQKFNLEGRAQVILSNVNAELSDAKMDIVVSNPPYISRSSKEVAPDVIKFEPELALFGGDLGWEIYNSWSQAALKLLKPGGLWCSEIGYDQGTILINLIASQNVWRDIEIRKDLCGQERYLLARKRD
jgi:release factor glutamine methyltransferase